MIAWAHVLAWPVAAIIVSANLRRAVAAVCLAIWPKYRPENRTKP